MVINHLIKLICRPRNGWGCYLNEAFRQARILNDLMLRRKLGGLPRLKVYLAVTGASFRTVDIDNVLIARHYGFYQHGGGGIVAKAQIYLPFGHRGIRCRRHIVNHQRMSAPLYNVHLSN